MNECNITDSNDNTVRVNLSRIKNSDGSANNSAYLWNFFASIFLDGSANATACVCVVLCRPANW